MPNTLRDRVAGCLLGGAVGDALGAPVEFPSLAEIRRRFGAGGHHRLRARLRPRWAPSPTTPR